MFFSNEKKNTAWMHGFRFSDLTKTYKNLNKSPKIGALDFDFVKKIQVFSGSSFRGTIFAGKNRSFLIDKSVWIVNNW